MKPLISIIIPIHNVKKYIKKCIESCLNQTLKNIEILCIDDCSPDDEYLILQEYAKKDSRIKLFKNEKNIGTGSSRNKLLPEAQGEYIYCLDGDDCLYSNTVLETFYKKAKQKDIDICIAGLCKTGLHYYKEVLELDSYNKTCKQTEQILKYNTPYFTQEIASKVSFLHYPWSASRTLYKKDFIIENDLKFGESMVLAEDIVFSHKGLLCKNATKIMFIEDIVLNININPNSITNRKTDKAFNVFTALDYFNFNLLTHTHTHGNLAFCAKKITQNLF